MGFPILVRCHLYIESGPWLWIQGLVLVAVHSSLFTGAVWLSQCQWSKPEGCGWVSEQSQTTTKHNEAWAMCRILILRRSYVLCKKVWTVGIYVGSNGPFMCKYFCIWPLQRPMGPILWLLQRPVGPVSVMGPVPVIQPTAIVLVASSILLDLWIMNGV